MSLAAPVALVRPLLGVGDTVVSDAQVRKLMSERDKGARRKRRPHGMVKTHCRTPTAGRT
jgi:hypothetical protein